MVTDRTWTALGTAAVLVAAVLLGGCRDLEPSTGNDSVPEGRAPELVIFVFDRSSSVKEHELEHARALTRERLGRLEHGDRIVAMELLRLSLAEEPRRWAQQVPERRLADQELRSDSVTRSRFIRDARDYVARFSDPEDRDEIDGTDILSTLHLVASELRAHPEHRPSLVLYSDMLQANREMNMEGLVRMPSDAWVPTQAARGLLPDLGGLCVVVVGARTDNRSSQIVKDFWRAYFEETGAILQDRNYDYRPVRLPERPCPER